MKNSLNYALAALLCLLPLSHATIIYHADDTNVNSIENTVTGDTAQSFAAGILTISNTGGGNNYNGGFASQQNIDSQLGRPLLTTETVILRLTVDSLAGNLNANGFEFGLSPDNSGFRPNGHAIFQIRANEAINSVAGNAFDGGGSATFSTTESSLYDGFSMTLTANQGGYIFEVTDTINNSGTGNTYAGTFSSPAQFQSVVGGGFFYTAAQKNAADMTFAISTASIDVIPEPAPGALLLTGLLLTQRGLRKFLRAR